MRRKEKEPRAHAHASAPGSSPSHVVLGQIAHGHGTGKADYYSRVAHLHNEMPQAKKQHTLNQRARGCSPGNDTTEDDDSDHDRAVAQQKQLEKKGQVFKLSA